MSSPVARARALITPTGVFVALVPIAAAVILYYGRGTTFFVDDWQWIAGRRDWTLATFLHPHNQHLSLIPIAIYKLLFVTVGIGHYWPYRVAVVAVHVLCSVLVFVLVRRRLGGWEAVVAGGLILFLGSATDDLLWG
ncbi:MAG: hypothetical protein QOG68_979, partial [Solirubrobacteraceae bacterium]|nr:hypothetical protein [Solirubrobacteraceae bacterium]